MRRPVALLCLPLSALALSACAHTVSTSAFKGAQQQAAQAVANLQSDATAAEQKKICANDLAGPLVARLGGTKGCEKAIKTQLAEIDSLEVTVESVQVASDGTSATAQVKSIHEGKNKPSSVLLVKEDSKWKVAGL
jgi:hypothetical protein